MTTIDPQHLTPRAVVAELDRYIVGQAKAKRAVAIALRNRWRRTRVEGPLRDEIAPKNIIMVGPTGCGKTEIARRLARLSGAPFVKVEVSKFTEVGYVGRDVDSIVRDLVEAAVAMVREEQERGVRARAREQAEERVLAVLLPPSAEPRGFTDRADAPAGSSPTRERLRELLRGGALDEREVEIEVEEGGPMPLQMPAGMPGAEQIGQQLRDMFGGLGRRTRKRKVKVSDALELLTREEAGRLVDAEAVGREAVARAEQLGVVFLDEIDKVCSREGVRGGDVSREGVQRDLLPLVEGSTVTTKYGPVKTDHVLFIAAGAFHMARVSDLMPELQGRFPIRVELDALRSDDFVRILREPDSSLLKQAVALLATEGVDVTFDDGAVAALADAAWRANAALENIGARRLHTVLERVLDELSFEASELVAPGSPGERRTIPITAEYVHARLDPLLGDQELGRHIL
jgi:ATP-dependent HslUV protease ATP-binding subunit HslU